MLVSASFLSAGAVGTHRFWWGASSCNASGVHSSLGRFRGSPCASTAGSWGTLCESVCVKETLRPVTQSDVRSHPSVSESHLNPLEKVIIRLLARVGATCMMAKHKAGEIRGKDSVYSSFSPSGFGIWYTFLSICSRDQMISLFPSACISVTHPCRCSMLYKNFI